MEENLRLLEMQDQLIDISNLLADALEKIVEANDRRRRETRVRAGRDLERIAEKLREIAPARGDLPDNESERAAQGGRERQTKTISGKGGWDYLLFTDGACRGNSSKVEPGKAAIACVLVNARRSKIIEEFAVPLERPVTNNIAEYEAMIEGLKRMRNITSGKIRAYTDSQLMQRQLIGEYATRNRLLQALRREVRKLAAEFSSIEWRWVPRSDAFIVRADQLANQALDQGAKIHNLLEKGD